MTTQVVTPKGQFSYPSLFTPKINTLNGNKEYSVDILFPKSTDLKTVHEGINAAIEKKFGSDKTKHPKNLRSPIRDGDEKENNPEYAGKYYITCKCNAEKNKPQVFDRSRKQLVHESDIAGGDFGHVLLNFYAYEKSGNKGVSAGLNGVMLVEKTSEPFSGSKSAFEAFESLAEDVSLEEQNSDMFQ